MDEEVTTGAKVDATIAGPIPNTTTDEDTMVEVMGIVPDHSIIASPHPGIQAATNHSPSMFVICKCGPS